MKIKILKCWKNIIKSHKNIKLLEHIKVKIIEVLGKNIIKPHKSKKY